MFGFLKITEQDTQNSILYQLIAASTVLQKKIIDKQTLYNKVHTMAKIEITARYWMV